MSQPRSRGRRPGIYQALDLVVCFFALIGLARADTGKVLTHAQIADRARPGTVLIKTIWTADIQVGRQQIDVRQLINFVNNQVALELVPRNDNAKVKAIFDELLAHPTKYLRPSSGPPIRLKVHTVATGSGFIVTPDGYILTNAHVIYDDDDDLKATIVQFWQHNELQAVIKQDFENFQKAFGASSAVDAQAIEDKLPDFVKAEAQYYERYIRILNTETRIFAEQGVALPGLRPVPKDIPCDLRKRGEPTPGKDVAVLRIEQNNLPTVAIGDDSGMRAGDPLVVIGYPGAADLPFMASKGIEATLTQGELSARKEMPGGWSALQTSAEINHGNSGGPAFNERGEVIGLATFGPIAEGVRGINFLVPIDVAKEFLDELGVKPRQSRLSELYTAALDDMDNGAFKRALEKFKEVSDLSPGFPFIQNKIAQSRNSIDQGLDRGWMGNSTYLIGGAATLLVVLTMLWFVMRRSPAAAPLPAGFPGSPGVSPVGLSETAGGPARPAAMPKQESPSPIKSFGTVQCLSGSASGQRYEVTKQGLLVGRDPINCQIVLNDDSVSKEHAWIVPVDEGTVIIDRGSTNGTFLNSADSPKISKVRLQDGDRIFIGKSSAVLTYRSS